MTNAARKLAVTGAVMPYLIPKHGFYADGMPSDLPFWARVRSFLLELALRARLAVIGLVRGLRGTGVFGVGRLCASVIRADGRIEHLGLICTKLITDAGVGQGEVGSGAGSGTEFTQDVGGTLTTSGAFAAVAQKVHTGTLTTAGALTKQTATAKTGALSSVVGVLAKQTQRALTGAVSSAGALASSLLFNVVLTGTLTTAGALSRQTQKVLAATLSTAGALLKQAQRFIAGALSTAGALSSVRFVQVVLTATLSAAGELFKKTQRALTGTLLTAGALATIRVVLLELTATLSTAGALVGQAQKALVGTLSPSGALVKFTQRSLAGAVSFAGAVAGVLNYVLDIVGTFGPAPSRASEDQEGTERERRAAARCCRGLRMRRVPRPARTRASGRAWGLKRR